MAAFQEYLQQLTTTNHTLPSGRIIHVTAIKIYPDLGLNDRYHCKGCSRKTNEQFNPGHDDTVYDCILQDKRWTICRDGMKCSDCQFRGKAEVLAQHICANKAEICGMYNCQFHASKDLVVAHRNDHHFHMDLLYREIQELKRVIQGMVIVASP